MVNSYLKYRVSKDTILLLTWKNTNSIFKFSGNPNVRKKNFHPNHESKEYKKSKNRENGGEGELATKKHKMTQ